MSNVFTIHTKYPCAARHVIEISKRVLTAIKGDMDAGYTQPLTPIHIQNEVDRYVYGVYDMALNDCMDVIRDYGLTKAYDKFYLLIESFGRGGVRSNELERILCSCIFRCIMLENNSKEYERLLTVKEPIVYHLKQHDDESSDDD
jgi:hypothetical protein